MDEPKIIVLDRDGVINYDSDDYIKTVDEWIPLPGSMEAIGELTKAGYQIAVATNQSGIARGYFTVETLNAMHDKMAKLAAEHGGKFDFIAYCPHGPDDNCDCRKPLPGLIEQIESALNVSTEGCYIVGDSLRDLEAGLAKGLRPVLVKTGKGERTLNKGLPIDNVIVSPDLLTFVKSLIEK